MSPPKKEEKKKRSEKIFEIIVENFANKGKRQSSLRSTENPILDKPKEKHAKTHIN